MITEQSVTAAWEKFSELREQRDAKRKEVDVLEVAVCEALLDYTTSSIEYYSSKDVKSE